MPKPESCSICGTNKNVQLVAGSTGSICDRCIASISTMTPFIKSTIGRLKEKGYSVKKIPLDASKKTPSEIAEEIQLINALDEQANRYKLNLNKSKTNSPSDRTTPSSGSHKSSPTSITPILKPMLPKEIKARLDDYVIGQEYAKKVISIAIHNHIKRINHPDIYLEKTNIITPGPTGSGKTHITRTLSKILDVPYTVYDATNLTVAGYIGQDVENIILNLYLASNKDKEATERGIVHIDEVDKLARQGVSDGSKDINGEGVQQALLRMIEGTEVEFTIPAKGMAAVHGGNKVKIDTTNILFIFSGAFSGISDLVSKRNTIEKSSIGFTSATNLENNNYQFKYRDINHDDLLSYGFIPEFIGRIPLIAALEELSVEEMMTILTSAKDSVLTSIINSFQLDGIDLSFEDDALMTIARLAKAQGTGARGLKTIIEQNLIDLMYTAPSSDLVNSSDQFVIGKYFFTHAS